MSVVQQTIKALGLPCDADHQTYTSVFVVFVLAELLSYMVNWVAKIMAE
jgi:hypothetical protein